MVNSVTDHVSNVADIQTHSRNAAASNDSNLRDIEPVQETQQRVNPCQPRSQTSLNEIAPSLEPIALDKYENHFSPQFLQLKQEKDVLYTKEVHLIDQIFDMSPLEYQDKISALDSEYDEFTQKVELYYDNQLDKASADYTDSKTPARRANDLIQAERKTLLAFKSPKDEFVSLLNFSSLKGKSHEGKNNKLKWQMHLAFNQLLENWQEYQRANQAFKDFEQGSPEYKHLAEQEQSPQSKFQELLLDSKNIKREKVFAALNLTVNTPSAEMDSLQQRQAALDAKLEEFIDDETKVLQTGAQGMGSSYLKAQQHLAAKVNDIQNPYIGDKKQTFFEEQKLAQLSEKLHKLNQTIEKTKRTEGSIGFKLAHLRHQVALPQHYRIHESDSEELRALKHEYNTAKNSIATISQGIPLRKVNDATLLQLERAANKIYSLASQVV